MRFTSIVVTESSAIIRHFTRSWRVLWALTVIESRRKYAGSLLGMLWYPLYSALLLGCYCFVYMVILHARFAGLGTYEYVLFITLTSLALGAFGGGGWSIDRVIGEHSTWFERWRQGWHGLLIAAVAGGGGASLLLVTCWRPQRQAVATAQ